MPADGENLGCRPLIARAGVKIEAGIALLLTVVKRVDLRDPG